MTDSPRRLEVGLFLPAGELLFMGGTLRWNDILGMSREGIEELVPVLELLT